MNNWKLWIAVILVCVIAGLWIFSGPILRAMGAAMVNEGPPVKVDMVLVLAGDGTGYRILKGAELAQAGYAPQVLVSNGGGTYGRQESDMATDFAIQRGYSPDLFIAAHWHADSTLDEGRRALTFMRKRGVHKIIIVTTLWHTARAGRIYRRLAPDMELHMVGAYDYNWNNGDWWKTREGRKTFFMEGVKTIADYLGI